MQTITLKGREIPLYYTTYEMMLLQKEIAPMKLLFKKVTGRNPDDEKDMSLVGGPEHLESAARLVRILGNAGLEEIGEEPDLTDRKVMKMMRPSDLLDAVNACMDAMTEGMESEIPEKEQEGPVDVTLEEMKRKKEKAG